ncbi:MAG: DUF2127 domain-containing protein [Deltaproteobacteria bacterium]|nr:DUF2127 domain-containing protein [Deltaproteobacteria bacterium]
MKQKNYGFLRFIIFYKVIMGAVELTLAAVFLSISESPQPVFTALAGNLKLDPENHFIKAALTKAVSIDHGTLLAFTFLVFIMALFNLVEAWGLHLRQRWAEWFTVIATSLLIPYEAYLLATGFSFLKIAVLALNSAVVYYLARHKELFEAHRVAESLDINA